MVEQKSIKVSLLGKTFSIVTDESPELIEQAARRVDVLNDALKEKAAGGSEIAKVAFVSLQVSIELEKKHQALCENHDKLAKAQEQLVVQQQVLTVKQNDLVAVKKEHDTTQQELAVKQKNLVATHEELLKKQQELAALKKQTNDILGRLQDSLGKYVQQ